MIGTGRTNDLVEKVRTEASSLQTFLSHLDERTWSSESTSKGWTIEDVVAHLAGNIDNWTNNIIRAVAGDFTPPEGQAFLSPRERASHPSCPGARESRRISGLQILDIFIAGHDRFQKVLETLGKEDWDKLCFHRRGVITTSVFVGLQIQELALHGWDIRWGLNRAAELSESCLPVLVDLVPRWIDTAFMTTIALPTPVRYRFDVSGPVIVRQDLVINSDSYDVLESDIKLPDVIFRCETGNYILMMYGRLAIERAVRDGRLSVEGSMELAKDFNTWFKGF